MLGKLLRTLLILARRAGVLCGIEQATGSRSWKTPILITIVTRVVIKNMQDAVFP